MRRLLLVFAIPLVLTTGCKRSFHDVKVLEAENAAAHGNVTAAAAAWEAACRVEPDDRASCERGRLATEKVRNTSLGAAKASCEAGEIDNCVAELAGIRTLRPNDASVLELLAAGFNGWSKRCAMTEHEGNLDSVLTHVECMASKTRLVNDPRFTAIVKERRQRASMIFSTATASRPPASAYVFARTAACLAPRQDLNDRAQAAGAALVASSALPIAVHVRNTGPNALSPETMSLCATVSTTLGPRARCADVAPPDFTLDLGASLGRVGHRASEEVKMARYVAGTEQIPNPERPGAEMELSRAQRSFDRIEQETHDREMRCNATRTPQACNSYNASVPVYNRRIQELNNAKMRLANTPVYFERDIVRTVPYTVRHHVWTAPYVVTPRLGIEAMPPSNGSFVREDSENPAVPVANVPGDPLEAPTMDDFDRSLRGIMVDAAKVSFARAFSRRAPCIGKGWSMDSPDLECRAQSEFRAKTTLPDSKEWMKVACE